MAAVFSGFVKKSHREREIQPYIEANTNVTLRNEKLCSNLLFACRTKSIFVVDVFQIKTFFTPK